MSWLKRNWCKLSFLVLLVAIVAFIFYPYEDCNVQGIEFHGELVTYKVESEADSTPVDQTSSDDILGIIQMAESDPEIKAILLEVDSYGGSGVAAEEIADALKHSTKPTVAQIRGSAVSAAYWATTGANAIFASANSDVGGIGVTMSYLQNVGQNIRDGLEFIELNTGKFKNSGDPNKPLTTEERALFQRDLDILLGNFIDTVSKNRNIPTGDVKKLADGSSMPGVMALQNKLIDKIGGLLEVKEYLKAKIGEEPKICW